MFPSAKIRFAAAARRGFDLALEFATLGEYRLPEESPSRASAARATRRPTATAATATAVPAAELRVRPRATRLRPATAAARRLQPEPSRRSISPHTGVRALALGGEAPKPQRGGRKRAGSARARPQPCLVADGRVPTAERGP
jgi:hypothetical protein